MKRGLQIFQRKAGQDENAKPSPDLRRRTLPLSGTALATSKSKNDRQSRPSGLLRRSLLRASNSSSCSRDGPSESRDGGKDAGIPQRRRTLLGKQCGRGMAASLSMPDAMTSSSDAGEPPLDLSSNAARDALLSIGEMGEIVEPTENETMNTATPSTTEVMPTSPFLKAGVSTLSMQKQLDDLQVAIRDLRFDNAALRAELAQLKLDHASSVSALCSEIARLQTKTMSLKGCPPAPSGLPHTSSWSRFRPSAQPFTTSLLAATSSAHAASSTALPPTASGLPIRFSASSLPATVALSSTLRQPTSQESQKFLRAQATLLAAERAEALLAGLSEEARQAVRTGSKREGRTSDQTKTRLSALFRASGSTSKLSEDNDRTRPLSLSRDEAVDALVASHAILELQQLCDLHENSNHGSFDSLLSEDCRSGSPDLRGLKAVDMDDMESDDFLASTSTSPDSFSVYSARGSSPEKLNVSPFATLTATPFSQSDVSLQTEQACPDAPSGVHPASLVKNLSAIDITAAMPRVSFPKTSLSNVDIVAKPPSPMAMPPHQRLVSSNSKSRIPIPLGWRRLDSSSPPSPPLSLTTFTSKSKSSSPTGASGCGNAENLPVSGSAGITLGKGSRMSEDQRGSPMYGSVALSGVPKPF